MNGFSRLITTSDATSSDGNQSKDYSGEEDSCFQQWCQLFFIYEKPRQIVVIFSVQSRKEICKESLLPPFSTLTFLRLFCHLWLLRLSFVAFDLVISGL
jgi:hypothetical protein